MGLEISLELRGITAPEVWVTQRDLHCRGAILGYLQTPVMSARYRLRWDGLPACSLHGNGPYESPHWRIDHGPLANVQRPAPPTAPVDDGEWGQPYPAHLG